MPKLEGMSKSATSKPICIYGPSLSGKTTLACALAKGMKVILFDGENGSSVLFDLPAAWHKNIFVQRIRDNKDTPSMIITMGLVLSGAKTIVCDKHGIVMNAKPTVTPCLECLKAHNAAVKEAEAAGKPTNDLGILNQWELNALDDDHVVVMDSFTQLTSSSNAQVTRGLKGEFEFEEFKHHRAQGKLLEKCLDYIQAASYNCIVIAHEEGIKQVDGTEKIIPAGGTTNFGRKVARYFGGGSIYCGTKNKKHIILANTTDDTRILAGIRGGATIDPTTLDSRADGMLALFGR